MLAAGLVLGLTIGGALAGGIWLGRSQSDAAGISGLGELKLQAMASHGGESFAIATGPIDENVEGLFTLDYLTGDLQCYVINPRTGGLGGWFKTNIAKDLAIEQGKKPSYLIATGALSSAGGAYGNIRPAGCVCYVVDANTGQVAAYTFPWAKGATATNATQFTEMKLIYKWKARTLELRE
jgi:hypothetical protein